MDTAELSRDTEPSVKMRPTKLLQRIKHTGPTDKLDANLLASLCMGFSSNIPFENLDMFGGQKKALDLFAIYKNIVEKGRGGFCCELNSLMHWLLSSLGYQADMCMANTLNKEIDTFNDIGDHMVLIVSLSKDEKLLVDVGWGGTSFVLPLRLHQLQAEQSQPNGVYKINYLDGFYIIEKKKQTQIQLNGEIVQRRNNEPAGMSKYQTNAEWGLIYGLTTENHTLSDFKKGFDYAQESHPYMTQNCTAVLQDKERRIFLIGNSLVEKKYIDPLTVKVTRCIRCSNTEIEKVLKRKFGLAIDFELKPKAKLHWTTL